MAIKTRHIDLQLFAEGETIPEEAKAEGADIENKPEDEKKETHEDGFSIIRKAFGLKEKKADGQPKPEDKKDGKQGGKASEKPGEKKQEPKPEDKGTEKKPEKPDTKAEPGKDGQAQAESETYEIVHLGKKIKIPAAERDKYLQMGYDYPHVRTEYEKSRTALQRAAKLEGFDKVEDYLAELDKREKTKLAEQIEEAAGDAEKIDEIIKNHPLVKETQEEKRKLEYEKKIAALKGEKFFKELEPELSKLLEQNPEIDPNLAFSVLVGNYIRTGKYDEALQKTKEAAEKRVVADMHDKERRATPTGGDVDDGTEEIARPTSTMTEIAKAFGVSASKVAQRIAKNKK